MVSARPSDGPHTVPVPASPGRRAAKIPDRAVIRFAEPTDGAALAAIYAPIVVDTAISFEAVPPSAAQMAERVAAIAATWPYLVAEIDGAVAGYAYASTYRERAAYRWSVSVTAYVAEPARGRGVGASLYTALLALLREQGYRTAFAGITLPNTASVALHERHGFRHIGTDPNAGHKLGRWWDVGRWALELQNLPDDPAEPIPISLLSARTERFSRPQGER